MVDFKVRTYIDVISSDVSIFFELFGTPRIKETLRN